MPDSPTTWPDLWAALREMDGEDCDVESERLDDLWKTEYQVAFVAHALTRRGWDKENAEVWASEIVSEALSFMRGGSGDPVEAAHADVLECEMESDNA